MRAAAREEEENSLSREVEDTKNRGLEASDDEDGAGLIQDNYHGLRDGKAENSKQVPESNPYIED